MSGPAGNFYADWRSQCRAADVLRDQSDSPPERLLQAIWQRQRLLRDALKTSDGKPVRVFHPGFANAEGGPDFRGAVLQIGDDAPRAGDVEIDLRAGGWRAHGHNRNPRFQQVLLHVIWDEEVYGFASTGQGAPPLLSLRNVLDAPLAELSRSLENESLGTLPENLRGKCSAPLRELDEARLAELLRAAAEVRLENKAAQLLARARNAGWEQALWENLFRALGYKHNAWPMQNLAESRLHWSRGANSAFELQARLLGLGGLLPHELTRAQKCANSYLRRVWDIWWRERGEFAGFLLPRAVWKFHGLRPANHPQRRLALASHWLVDKHLVPRIEKWCAGEILNGKDAPPRTQASRHAAVADWKLPESLLKVLQIGHDDFWSWHWTFRSAQLKNPQPLLGGARVTDLATNVILPWLWIRAKEGGNKKIQAEVERRYFAWPAAEDNSLLKLARQRLLATSRPGVLRTAAAQQGLIQIVRDFCEHSNAICEHCRFPELVRGGGW
jgi:Protein of unknown function (DUF2851)